MDLVRTPSNYNNAWFEIKFVKVFTESVSAWPLLVVSMFSNCLHYRNSSGGSITAPIPSTTGSGGSGGRPTSSTAHSGAAFAIFAPLKLGSVVAALSTVLATTLSTAMWMF